MKIHVEIDCTPEEARDFMGLPNVSKANDIYVDSVANAMKGASNPEQLQQFVDQLAPMGQAGLKLFQSFIEGANAVGDLAGAGKGFKSSPSDSSESSDGQSPRQSPDSKSPTKD